MKINFVIFRFFLNYTIKLVQKNHTHTNTKKMCSRAYVHTNNKDHNTEMGGKRKEDEMKVTRYTEKIESD